MENKTAIITGASRGIGKALSRELASQGSNLFLNSLNEETLKETAAEIKSEFGVRCEYLAGSVSELEVSKKIISAALEKFSNINYLVNNAGISKDNLLLKMSEEEWDAVIDVNLKGTFNTIKSVSRTMLKQKYGSILNISSIIGKIGNIGQVNYSAAKAGILGLTRSVAKEFAPKGITCNAICPGFIDTDMTKKLPDEIKEKYTKIIPLGRFGNAEDVAKAAVFLLKASYITGQALNIDGGIVMGC